MTKNRKNTRKKTNKPVTRSSQGAQISPAIPIVALILVGVLVIGAIISLERQSPNRNSGLGAAVASNPTAEGLPTLALPYPHVPRISVQETDGLMKQGQALLVDVRSQASYDKAHAAGALSLPEAQVDARYNDLPSETLLVLYCT